MSNILGVDVIDDIREEVIDKTIFNLGMDKGMKSQNVDDKDFHGRLSVVETKLEGFEKLIKDVSHKFDKSFTHFDKMVQTLETQVVKASKQEIETIKGKNLQLVERVKTLKSDIDNIGNTCHSLEKRFDDKCVGVDIFQKQCDSNFKKLDVLLFLSSHQKLLVFIIICVVASLYMVSIKEFRDILRIWLKGSL